MRMKQWILYEIFNLILPYNNFVNYSFNICVALTNSLQSADAYMCQANWLSFVQVMACHLIGNKTTRISCDVLSMRQCTLYLNTILFEIRIFSTTKSIQRCGLNNFGHCFHYIIVHDGNGIWLGFQWAAESYIWTWKAVRHFRCLSYK